MSGGRIDRIVVFCLSLETAKVVKPVEFYKPDRAYMLYLTDVEAYRDFKREVEGQVRVLGVPVEGVQTEVWDFASTLRELVHIFRKERGNTVYVNVDGPGAYPAAAMVASMMEGGRPFFARTLEQNIPYAAYYRKGKPVGRSSKVADPEILPDFSMKPPDDELVRGLAVWIEMENGGRPMRDAPVITELSKNGLLSAHAAEAGERKKRSQSEKMFYRRHFLEKWISQGWLERDGRGRHHSTDYGRVVASVFADAG